MSNADSKNEPKTSYFMSDDVEEEKHMAAIYIGGRFEVVEIDTIESYDNPSGRVRAGLMRSRWRQRTLG